ncbi:MAG: hypothetical protein QOE36_3564 [Gaiellaceae bacterium]|nr:hypothetical protein [Gaiellaceae bacterium]
MLFLAVGLSGRPSVVPLALVALGAEYLAAWGASGAGVDGRAPVYGGALLLVAELAYWSLETDAPTVDDPAVRTRRLGSVAALAGSGAAVGALLVGLSAVRIGSGIGTDALGVAAAAAAFVAIVALALRR